MSDEYYSSSQQISTETKSIISEYLSGKEEVPVINRTIPSTNTKEEGNVYSKGKPRRVIIKARITDDRS